MGNNFHFLQQMYDEILGGILWTKDSHAYAVFLDPLLPPQHLSAENTESCMEKCLLFSDAWRSRNSSVLHSLALEITSEPDMAGNVYHPREIALLQLTLIEMMVSKVHTLGVEAGIKQKYHDVVSILVKEASIDSELICLLDASDKPMSHMACKSLVSLVHFQLREEGSLNSSWLTFCSEALSGFPSSTWTAECLWTLTNVTREILKDESLAKGGALKKLFSPLSGILEDFYHRILSQVSDVPEGIPAFAKYMNDLSSFLDLLELLTASRMQTEVHFPCQRMLFLNVACVLTLTTSSVHDFIKKKSVVLLKRCILGKAGEDIVAGKVPLSFLQDPCFDEDRIALSSTVLQFVSSGWLNRLCVSEKVDHFGGSQVRPELNICNGPDKVFLRSLSLVLLKALEIRIQNSTSEAEAQALLEDVMCSLLSFLKHPLRSSPCVLPFKHPCAWLSELFIEQDDDMFEAAKVLLRVHLHFKRFWYDSAFPSRLLDERTWDALTHRNGCNPHCIFLFLLGSIAFDAAVLLDFLISSETCFLEYLVRYLKLLIEDWYHFAQISEGLTPMPSGGLSFSSEDPSCPEKHHCQSQLNWESMLPDSQYPAIPLPASSQNCSVLQQVDNKAVKSTRPCPLRGSDNTSSLGSIHRLVDYESSEDSEVEEECLADRTQTLLNNQAYTDVTTSTDLTGQAEILEHVVLPLDHNDLTVPPPSQHEGSPSDPISVKGTLRKSLKCLGELQKSISRLHRRNLFPYNPTALVKLLTCVDAVSKSVQICSKQSKSRDIQRLPLRPHLHPHNRVGRMFPQD